MKKTMISLIGLAVLIFAVSSQTFASLPIPIPSPNVIILTQFNKAHQVESDLAVGCIKYFTVLSVGDVDYLSIQPDTGEALMAAYYVVMDPTVNEVTGSGVGIINCDNRESCNEIRIPIESYFSVTYIAVCPLQLTEDGGLIDSSMLIEFRLRP